MSGLFKLWLALLAGAATAAVVYRDNGYALLSYGNWSIEMSLAMLLLITAATFTVAYLTLRLLAGAARIPSDARKWQRLRGARLARQNLTRGLIELSEGDWLGAEKHLIKSADHSETPLLNYLAAARAAQLQGAHDRRDGYIRLAHESMPAADIAVSLTQAELQLADNQLEQALATLRHLRQIAPKHTYVLRMLRRLYERLGDWDQLKELLPELSKRNVIPAEDRHDLEIRVYSALLERASLSVESTRVTEIWNQIPRKSRRAIPLVEDYAGYLQERGRDEEAEQLLHDTLKTQWSTKLVALYGQLETAKPAKQLALAEHLLEQHPHEPTLLLALGRLCLRAKLWGKARSYLEASIRAGGDIAAFRELGNLLEQLGEAELALDVYRRGLDGTETPTPIKLPGHIGSASINKPALQDQDADTEQQPTPHSAAVATDPS